MTRPGLLAADAPRHWIDNDGKRWRTMNIIGRIKYRIPGAYALRRFVYARDGFACVRCGAKAIMKPGWDGSECLGVEGQEFGMVLDHIISRRNGGAHHPDNLQTMCDSCNARKACREDRR